MSHDLVIAGWVYTRDKDARYLEALERAGSDSAARIAAGYSVAAVIARLQNDAEFKELVKNAKSAGKDYTYDRLNSIAEGRKKVKREYVVMTGEDGLEHQVGAVKVTEEIMQDPRAAEIVAKMRNPEAFLPTKDESTDETPQIDDRDAANIAQFIMKKREKENAKK